jgi:hypothetical protein
MFSCCSHDGVRTRHHRDIQEESLKRYSVIVARLLFFVMRCHQGWNSKYSMDLTATQQEACKALYDALRGYRLSSNESGDAAGEGDWYIGLEISDDDLFEDIDDEESEDDEVSPTDQPENDSAPDAGRGIAETPIQAAILALLIALYTQLPSGREDKFFSPILRFAVLASLRSTAGWLPPRRITHHLAILLFCGREVVMAMMHQRLLDDPSIRYSK